MKYAIVLLDILCCILYAALAYSTDSIAYAACAVLWGICAAINTFVYIIKK